MPCWQHVDLHKILGIDAGFASRRDPFDFSRRRLSVVVAHGQDRHILICKGAVEEMFAVCTSYEIDGRKARSTKAISPPRRRRPIALNADGFRVVAVAYKEMDEPQAAYSVADEAI